MKLPITKTFAVVCALLAVAAGAGCNKKRTNNFFSDNDFLDGTTARDTIDLNIGQHAYPSSLGFVGGSSSSASTQPFYPVGPSGEINAFFTQQLTEIFESSFDNIGSLNYNRVLGDGVASAAQELGDHHTFAYQDNGGQGYTNRAQSYNKRYVALVDTFQGNPDESSMQLSILDTATGATTRSTEVLRDFFSQLDTTPSFEGRQLFVDNSGRATLIFSAQEANGVLGGAVGRRLFVAQVNADGSLHRALTAVSKAYTSNTASGNSTSFEGAAQAINGDIVILYRYTDGGGTQSLQSTVYDRSSDTFGAAARVDNGVNVAVGNTALTTDGRSFQLAFFQLPSGTASSEGAYTSRFVAQSGTNFGAAARIDNTGDGSVRRTTGTGLGINFGRDSTSIVHFGELESGQFRFSASWSDETVAPAAANTVRLTDDLTAGFFDSTPQYAFQDDGSAILVRSVVGTSGNSQIQVNTLDASAASPRISTLTAAANVTGMETALGGNVMRLDGVGLSGFSAGDNPTCVIGWSSFTTNGEGRRVSAALVSDLTVQARTQLSAESVTRFAIQDLTLSSLNDVQTLASYSRQYDSLVDPLTAPAGGNGAVWIAWRQLVPNAAGTSRTTTLHVWNYNPAVSTTTLGGATTVAKVGPTGDSADLEGIYPQTDGGAMIVHRHNGAPFRATLGAAGSLTSGATVGTPTITIPEDMVLENISLDNFSSGRFFGFHFDGFGYSYDTADDGANINASLHGGRLWSLFSGSDLLSSRVFAIRSR